MKEWDGTAGYEPFPSKTGYTMRTSSLVAREGHLFRLSGDKPNFGKTRIVYSVLNLEQDRYFVQMLRYSLGMISPVKHGRMDAPFPHGLK